MQHLKLFCCVWVLRVDVVDAVGDAVVDVVVVRDECNKLTYFGTLIRITTNGCYVILLQFICVFLFVFVVLRLERFTRGEPNTTKANC